MNAKRNLPYFYEQTNYPKIYGNSYWGHFKETELLSAVEPELIVNRNNFIPEFDIKSYYRMPKYMLKKYETMLDMNSKYKIDHIETYKTKDNRCVIVNSPYFMTEEDEKALLELGYVKYKPLYRRGSMSYIYIVPIGRY